MVLNQAEELVIDRVSRLSWGDLIKELSSRGVEFNERAPYDDLRQDLVFDIGFDEGFEAYLAAMR